MNPTEAELQVRRLDNHIAIHRVRHNQSHVTVVSPQLSVHKLEFQKFFRVWLKLLNLNLSIMDHTRHKTYLVRNYLCISTKCSFSHHNELKWISFSFLAVDKYSQGTKILALVLAGILIVLPRPECSREDKIITFDLKNIPRRTFRNFDPHN